MKGDPFVLWQTAAIQLRTHLNTLIGELPLNKNSGDVGTSLETGRWQLKLAKCHLVLKEMTNVRVALDLFADLYTLSAWQGPI